MRLSLRVSLLPDGWRWLFEDMDAAADVAVQDQSVGVFGSWRAAELAARAAHPGVDRVFIHAVRGYGVAFEDSL